MSDKPRVDAETLAALVDGRLSGKARADVIAAIADSGADAELLADVAAAVSEAEGVVGISEVVGAIRPRDASRWPAVLRSRGAMIAAGLAILLVPLTYWQVRSNASGDAREFARMYVAAGGTLPDQWDGRSWPVTRGGPIVGTDRALAARVGSRLVDLDVASRGGDSVAAQIAADLAAVVDGLPGAALITSPLGEISMGSSVAERDVLIERVQRAARSLLNGDGLLLGAWAEAARLAAARHDAAFFASRQSKRVLDQSLSRASDGSEERTALEAVRDATSNLATSDWTAIVRVTNALAAVITR